MAQHCSTIFFFSRIEIILIDYYKKISPKKLYYSISKSNQHHKKYNHRITLSRRQGRSREGQRPRASSSRTAFSFPWCAPHRRQSDPRQRDPRDSVGSVG